AGSRPEDPTIVSMLASAGFKGWRGEVRRSIATPPKAAERKKARNSTACSAQAAGIGAVDGVGHGRFEGGLSHLEGRRLEVIKRQEGTEEQPFAAVLLDQAGDTAHPFQHSEFDVHLTAPQQQC